MHTRSHWVQPVWSFGPITRNTHARGHPPTCFFFPFFFLFSFSPRLRLSGTDGFLTSPPPVHVAPLPGWSGGESELDTIHPYHNGFVASFRSGKALLTYLLLLRSVGELLWLSTAYLPLSLSCALSLSLLPYPIQPERQGRMGEIFPIGGG